MTHYFAHNAFNRKQVQQPQNARALGVCDVEQCNSYLKGLFLNDCEVSGIDLFFHGKSKINDDSVCRWVADPKGLGLGDVVSVERTIWRDGKGFTLTIMTTPNSAFDPIDGLLRTHLRFSHLPAYEGAEFNLHHSADERAKG